MCDISITPDDPLIDEVVKIKIDGLDKGQHVTVKAATSENDAYFTSFGCFVADEFGIVDLSLHESSSGTYKGIDSMGLFWSMKQAPGQERGTRYMKRIVSSHQIVHISVYDGHLHWYEIHSNIPSLASTVLNRFFYKNGVKRIEVNHGRLKGTIFIPEGIGPFPAVLDMFGISGGIIEFRAAMMASRGILAYALPYMSFEENPKLDTGYFQEAVKFLVSHPLAIGDGIGVCGVSKGGEVGLVLATVCPQIKAVVNINGPPYISYNRMEPFPEFVKFSHYDFPGIVEQNHVLHMSRAASSRYLTEDRLTKTWNTEAKILYIVGELDSAIDPKVASMFYEAYPVNRRHLVQIVKYPGAGHLIEPPYLPVCQESYVRSATAAFYKERMAKEKMPSSLLFIWGGESQSQAKASEHSWKLILDFFHQTLVPKNPVTKNSEIQTLSKL